MANIKSNERSHNQDVKKHKAAHANMSALRKNVKQTRNSNDASKIDQTYSMIDRTASKGRIHKNKANRLKSRTAIAINKANK